MTRVDVLNALVDKFGYNRYLEIGVAGGKTFRQVRVSHKVGVDPSPQCEVSHRMTSDAFFQGCCELFDLIFVDGLHTKNQCHRDIMNSLAVLKEEGTVVVHDCRPRSFEEQQVPMPPGAFRWTGNVWRAWLHLRANRPDLFMFVADIGSGCGVIRRGRQVLIKDLPLDVCWKDFKLNEIEWLNLWTNQKFGEWVGRG